MKFGKKLLAAGLMSLALTPAWASAQDLSYDGYSLVWEENFDGAKLNTKDWNYETHQPGWVNAELQAYVIDDKNIFLKDGKLVIKPIRTKSGNGYTYTSGRINTQNKHDFKYGIFEARCKVPKGQGYLPAFWMMPTNENVYGQWPRCGEIDCMEVMGQNTKKLFGTIHYGNPHKETQTAYIAKGDVDFSTDFHTYTVEWKPGVIKWYVDGELFQTATDWYSRTEGLGEITFPGPFDQPFYIIFNLAVGGGWVGNPDESTDFDNAAFEVDYVRAYQLPSYDESNVVKPAAKPIVFRDPDATGNLVVNGNFAAGSDVESNQWKFSTATGGVGSATVSGGVVNIATENEGKETYGIQLLQTGVAVKKGLKYRFSFDASADSARTMLAAVEGGEAAGWTRYLNDTTVALTPETKHYSYEFTMGAASNAESVVEFNMGKQGSTAGIHISNVRLEVIGGEEVIEGNEKKILSDGNVVYNSKFQEGKAHLGNWEITKSEGAEASVTPLEDGRRLKVVVPAGGNVTVAQTDLAIAAGKQYRVTYALDGDKSGVKVTAAGSTVENNSVIDAAGKDLVFNFDKAGTYYLDNVRIDEYALLKNGSFDADLAGFEVFVDASANASHVVDKLHEDGAVDFDVVDTGDADWKIQLKQNDMVLEQGKTYMLTFKAKSSIARNIQVNFQRNGLLHDNDWTPYGQQVVELPADINEYTDVDMIFTMGEKTDPNTIFNISMGAVGGKRITEQHRVVIDDLKLELLE